jgi:large subunit ribosomal protein L9
MDLILLERIQNLGELGDIVSVKSGYGRNFLIPQGKAVPASSDAKEKVEARRRELAQLDSERLDAAQAKAALLPDRLTVKRLAGEEGKLFGSVTPGDIAELLQAVDISVERAEVSMPVGPLKTLGEHSVMVLLHPEVSASLAIIVEAENQDGVVESDGSLEEASTPSE